ncbi:tail fiber domain-containing protein [Escherichia coli]|uniref:tail fiber domain-containing protein n=1 Tax=Escherichia coli TaxID=562 RepID=UPI001E44C2D4|nr:tail fiber domain-containing protein [Escherichia coli]
MIYNAGTISFSGNTVTGSGTSFTAPASQIRIGQTLLIASNPVQLVQITAINSATSLTVTPAASPAVSDQRYGIFVTDSLSVDGLAQSISQLINEYDENIGAWEAFASTTENQMVTVTINGVSLSIPAAGALARKGANSDITSISGLTTPLSRSQGGTGSDSPFGTVAGSFAQGNDERLNTVDKKTGGLVKSKIVFNANSTSKGITVASLNPSDFSAMYASDESSAVSVSPARVTIGSFYPEFTDKHYVDGRYAGVFYRGTVHTNTEPVVHWGYTFESGAVSSQILQYRPTLGTLYVSGSVTSPVIAQTSDLDCKDKVEVIPDAMSKINAIRGVTFNWAATGYPSAGVIAQEIKEVLPECISQQQNAEGERFYAVEYAGVVGLCVEAIKALNEKVGQLERALAGCDQG